MIFVALFEKLNSKFQGSGQQTKEIPYSISSQRSRIDPIGSMRNGSRNVGLPPPSKFRSGHLSGVIPVSRVIPGDLDESASASDNDMITDSEEEVYGGRYSLDSSPHDDRIPSTTAATQRYYNLPQRRATALYASDSVYSDDVSSSMETLGRGRGYVADRLLRGANRNPIGSSVYTEEESSDSAASSEFSSTQVGTNNGTVPRSTNYASEGYASSIPSRLNTGNKTQKVLICVSFVLN